MSVFCFFGQGYVSGNNYRIGSCLRVRGAAFEIWRAKLKKKKNLIKKKWKDKTKKLKNLSVKF